MLINYYFFKLMLSLFTLKNFLINFSWIILSQFSKIILGGFTFIYVVRYLGPNDFGLISYALSIIGILHPLSTLGLDAIIFRNIIRDKKNEKIIIKTSYLIRIVSGTILFLCTSLWFYFHGDNSVFNFIIFILAIGFILDAFVVYEGYFAAILQNKYISLSNIVSNIISNIFKVLFIYIKLNIAWIAFAYLLEKLIKILSLRYFYNLKSSKGHVQFDLNLSKQMMTDSWPLIFTSFAGMLYVHFDQILIKYYLNLEQVGLYAASAKLIIFLYFIPSIISNIIYPKIIELKNNLNSKDFIYKLELIYFVNFVLSLLLMSFILISGKWIVIFFLGSDFASSINILYIYSFSLIFAFFESNNNKLLMIDNFQKLMLIRNIFGLGLNVILNIFLIPKYGIEGAAYATIVSRFMVFMSYSISFKTRYIFLLQIKSMIFPILYFHKILNK